MRTSPVIMLAVMTVLLWAGVCIAAGAEGAPAPDDEVQRRIQELKDADPEVRRAAAWALGKLGDRRALEPLKALLNDEYESMHMAAAEALKQLGHEPGGTAPGGD